MTQPLIIEPPTAATASVIWLHGLGASADDFVGLPRELGGGSDHGLRFVLPNAPQRSVTVNDGMTMPAWYDIYGADIAARQDVEGLEASRESIDALIESEIERGIPATRIVLGGFSQGGALALHTGLRQSHRLAGLAILSAYLPLHDRLDAAAHAANAGAPIFMAHGHDDPVIPRALAAQSRMFLEQRGYALTWRDYDMAHEVCGAEITALADWLAELI